MDKLQLSHIFLLYCRDKHPFPRGALRLYPIQSRKGSIESKSLQTVKELQTFCQFNKDVYINLFSDDQKESKMYDMIFLDIDAETINKAEDKLSIVKQGLLWAGINHYYIMLSGSKGYHVYVPFEDTLLSNYRTAVLGWLKAIKIVGVIDNSAVEPNRVTRVPFSINLKSGEICKPLEDFTSVDCNITLGKWIKTFDKEQRTKVVDSKARLREKSKIFSDRKYYPECMQTLLGEAESGTSLGHIERLEMGIFLLHVFGDDIKKVMYWYSLMSDYKPHVTGYQLNYIIKNELKSRKCDSLREVGICPFRNAEEAEQECPFYPSLNHWYDKERKNAT